MNPAIRLIALTLLCYTLTNLISTEQILYYINPRFIPLTKFSLLFLGLLLVVSFIDLVIRVTRKYNLEPLKWTTVIVLLVVLSPQAFPPRALDSSIAGQKGFMVYQGSGKAAPGLSEKPGLDTLEEALVLADHNYLEIFNDLYVNQENYLGREIVVMGFIMKHKDLPDSYMVSRYGIACCAADAIIVGFVIPGEPPYPEDTWVYLRGYMRDIEEKGPRLDLIEVDEIVPPSVPYIYLY